MTGVTYSTQDEETDAKSMDFRDSSFFRDERRHRELPSPHDVFLRCDKAPRRTNYVVFKELRLFVKCGVKANVSTSEAMALRAVRMELGPTAPVPEIYGWRTAYGRVFLYMECIEGDTLAEHWDDMNTKERVRICDQLKGFFNAIREIKPAPGESFIGSVDHGQIWDYALREEESPGPFPSVEAFHDWISGTLDRRPGRPPNSTMAFDHFRPRLDDNHDIYLTHGDFHRDNIMVSSKDPSKLLAVVDWAQCAWLPEYWEYMRAWYHGVARDPEWAEKWLPRILDSYPEESAVLTDLFMAFGI